MVQGKSRRLRAAPHGPRAHAGLPLKCRPEKPHRLRERRIGDAGSARSPSSRMSVLGVVVALLEVGAGGRQRASMVRRPDWGCAGLQVPTSSRRPRISAAR